MWLAKHEDYQEIKGVKASFLNDAHATYVSRNFLQQLTRKNIDVYTANFVYLDRVFGYPRQAVYFGTISFPCRI